MILELITAIANAITAGSGVVKPVVEDHFQQKYRNEKVSNVTELQEILSMPESPQRGSRMCAWFKRMCSAAGTAAGDVSDGTFIRVPVQHWKTACEIIADKVEDEAMVSKIVFK